MKKARAKKKAATQEPTIAAANERALSPAHVETLRRTIEDHLRTADAKKFSQLAPLFEGNRLRLSRVLDTLYPNADREAQQTLLRNFRSAVNGAFREADLDARFTVDTRKRTPAEERFCWLEGRRPSEPLLTKYTEDAIGEATNTVEPRASVSPERKRVQYVVIYAEKDEPSAKTLIEMLEESMKSSRSFAFNGWAPFKLVAGEHREENQRNYDSASQIAIGLLSPELLADEQAMQRALALRSRGRLLLPLPLKSVDERRQNLGAFDGLKSITSSRSAFSLCRSDAEKQQFALELYRAIEEAVSAAKLPPAPPPEPPPSPRRFSAFHEQTRNLDLPEHTIDDAKAALTSVRLAGDEDESGAGAKTDSVPAVPYLQSWASDPDAPPFFALLGETGMGKTTTCKLLARRMLDAQQADPSAPLPIYLDLRRFSWDGTTSFTLETILAMVLAKSFRSGTGPIPSPADVIEHVQQQGAVVLFDGLDEVIVHMPPKIAQDFIRELWRILPPRKREASTARSGKLLLSCRSHYFRRVWEQNAMLLGEEREGIRPQDYRALVMLPFTTEQIEEYLAHRISDLDVARALELIRSVHNLSELAERPFTLSLIGEFLPDLERDMQAGKEIQGVDLYRTMVRRWLLRDEGKHQFNTAHKEVLMERLAARLWASARREWTAEELEDWLDDIMNADDRFRGAYEKQEREVLKEDLRTATFLVRPDAESFRFAHTSLQEFFLARFLQRALREGHDERWSLPMPSRETLEFLVQLVRGAPADRAACERTLEAILGAYRPLGSELALRFWLDARERGEAFRRPARLDLRGAQLTDWRFIGASGRRLDLRAADLRGADLRRAVFEHVILSGADLAGANASLAEFHDVVAEGLQVDSEDGCPADLSATLWRLSRVSNTDLRDVKLDRSRFIRCQFSAINWPPAGSLPRFADCREGTAVRSTLASRSKARFDAFTGHYGAVNGCAVSPEGSRIVTASFDNTARVWDASSGALLLTLQGHQSWVRACAFSTEGSRIVTASFDNTARVWDAFSGDSLLTLQGHHASVSACAFSPDGSRIVTASYDKTARVWDASSGAHLLTLQGHQEPVSGCAFSPDGSHIVTASSDKTARIWDASSGAHLLTLQGHQDSVSACVFGPDGSRIITASDDKTARVWDASSGAHLLTLQGHQDWVRACAVSPDGSRIVTASDDGSTRVWDASTGDTLLALQGHPASVRACAFSPNGSRIVTASYGKTARIWDASTGDTLLTLQGHKNSVIACAFSPDGARIVTASYDNTARVWDASTGDTLLTLQGHQNSVRACAFSPDGSCIVTASEDNTARVWDASSGNTLLTLQGHQDWVRACAFSPDGSRIVTASEDNTARVWDASSGALLLTLQGQSWVSACAVTPDGSRIVTASYDNTARIWDASSGDTLLTLRGHRAFVLACAFSPDGSRIITASYDGTTRVWDATSGVPLLTIAQFDTGNEAVFDESPRRLRRATAGAWRWLGWLAPDPATGFLERYPAESFGPLPGAE